MNSAKIIFSKIALSLVLIGFFTGTAYASEWPNIKSPPDTTVSWVGNDMVQNGVPLKIKSFSSSLSPEDIINFYRSEWDNESDRKAVINSVADWNIIGKQIGEYYLTVQAKAGVNTNSEGFMSVSKLPARYKKVPAVDFPMLATSRVISNTESKDPGMKAQTSSSKMNSPRSRTSRFMSQKCRNKAGR